MTYAEAVAYLMGLERLGIKFGLDNINALAEQLGRPERDLASILVAGTNGKGSTTALLESMLRAAGYRTGRYTSPHLVRLEERMTVSGRLIAPEELASVVATVRESVQRVRARGRILTEPTFFEVTTACAIEYFRRRKVDVAILEVGMGGRWDATNIAPARMSVITQIGFDHERFLGHTLEEIAAEKAATIKAGCPVVVGAIAPGPLGVIRSEAERQSAPLFEAARQSQAEARPDDGGQIVRLATPERVYEELHLPLAGAHQVDNLTLAVRAVEVAASVGFRVSEQAVARGVASTRWPARLERVPGTPRLLIDSAHNPLGARALAAYLKSQPPLRRVLLFAVMEDKNVAEILGPLLPLVDHVVVTRPPNRRAEDPGRVLAWVLGHGFHGETMEPTEEALGRARDLAGEGGEVVVAGSTFLAGEVKRILEEEKPPLSGAVETSGGGSAAHRSGQSPA